MGESQTGCGRLQRPLKPCTLSPAAPRAQVTTTPYPIHAERHIYNTDWRTDPVLLLFNAIASRAMRGAGIDVVDVWHIIAPLAELAYDTMHYKGTLGYNLGLHFLAVASRAAAQEGPHTT